MKKKIDFLTHRLLVFTSSAATLLIALISLNIHADSAFEIPANIIFCVCCGLYIFATASYTSMVSQKKYIIDEMAKDNELKAANTALSAAALLILGAMLFARGLNGEVTLSFRVLFCALFLITTIKEGAFLALEKGWFTRAATNDED